MNKTNAKITLIAAVSLNGIIGINNSIPWQLKDDIRHFQQTTIRSSVIMGRKTFDSIGKPLNDRQNIVLTRNNGWRCPGVITANTTENALESCETQEVYVIGGDEIYRQFMPISSHAIISHVNAYIEGDTIFDLGFLYGLHPIYTLNIPRNERNSHDFKISYYSLL